MSYCRWSECDVYAYDSCEGGVRFWVSGNDSLNRLCDTYGEAYQYAKELRDKHGLDVPSHAIDALREDAIDEAKQHLGPDSAVADTLGAETCHDKNGFDVTLGFECTVCGAMTDGYMLSPADTGHYKQFNFCPMCGRRVEQ